MNNYGKDHTKTSTILKQELQGLISFKPDCIIIYCNTLHKYYDLIKHELKTNILILHAVELVAQHLLDNQQKTVLLLATNFTTKDGFFEKMLQQKGIAVSIPNEHECKMMQAIHDELMHNVVTDASRDFFSNLIKKHQHLDAVILGCTEYPLVVDQTNSVLPIIDPVNLQVEAAVDYALAAKATS